MGFEQEFKATVAKGVREEREHAAAEALEALDR